MSKMLSVALSTLLAMPALAAEWAIDQAHTEIGFSVKHMMVTEQKGAFDKFEGTINVDDKDPTKSTVDVSIETSSVNTKNEKRDGHLKGADFFDSAKFPKMTFKSKSVAKGDKPNTFKVTGDLTIRDVTKPVVLDVEVSDVVVGPKEWGAVPSRGVKATAKINRGDFGLKWQTKLDKGGVVVGEEVSIMISAEMQPKAPAKK